MLLNHCRSDALKVAARKPSALWSFRWRLPDGRRCWAYDAAGNAVAGVAGRIARVVVLATMNHDRGALGVKDRIRFVLVERDGRVDHLHLQSAALRNMEIRHIASVADAGHHPVMSVAWVEMRTRR